MRNQRRAGLLALFLGILAAGCTNGISPTDVPQIGPIHCHVHIDPDMGTWTEVCYDRLGHEVARP